jgi:hypothetical protein
MGLRAGMEVAVGAADRHLLVDKSTKAAGDHRRVPIPHARVADEDQIAFKLALVGLDPRGQELGAVLLGALDQERHSDREFPRHGLPGPARLDEGHHLTLVVAGAPRADHLSPVGKGGDPGFEGRRVP